MPASKSSDSMKALKPSNWKSFRTWPAVIQALNRPCCLKTAMGQCGWAPFPPACFIATATLLRGLRFQIPPSSAWPRMRGRQPVSWNPWWTEPGASVFDLHYQADRRIPVSRCAVGVSGCDWRTLAGGRKRCARSGPWNKLGCSIALRRFDSTLCDVRRRRRKRFRLDWSPARCAVSLGGWSVSGSRIPRQPARKGRSFVAGVKQGRPVDQHRFARSLIPVARK